MPPTWLLENFRSINLILTLLSMVDFIYFFFLVLPNLRLITCPQNHAFLYNPNPFKSGYHMINISLFVNIAYLYDFLVWFHVLKICFEFVYRVLLNFYRKLVELLYISLAQVNGKILSANVCSHFLKIMDHIEDWMKGSK